MVRVAATQAHLAAGAARPAIVQLAMSENIPPAPGRVAAAFALLKNWMLAHAPLLAENLAAGAPTAHLDAIEEKLGFAFPADLRELWLLHDGQMSEQSGFVGALDLFTAEQALSERDGVLMFVDFLQQAPSEWAEAGVTDDEARSDRWLPFAGRDSDTLAVNCVTGRVFSCGKDVPPLHLVATSVTEWIEQYADRVERGAYKVEEGFGDYFLARDDAMFVSFRQECVERGSKAGTRAHARPGRGSLGGSCSQRLATQRRRVVGRGARARPRSSRAAIPLARRRRPCSS
jgi:cell wall assembly regulator SMI1